MMVEDDNTHNLYKSAVHTQGKNTTALNKRDYTKKNTTEQNKQKNKMQYNKTNSVRFRGN